MAKSPSKRVLLVGDSSLLQDLLQGDAECGGASVGNVPDPDQCLRALAGQGYDLLIADLNGDACTMLQLLQSCHQLLPCMPCLAVVAQGDVATAVRAMKAGAADCIERPVDPQRFHATVAPILRNGQAEYASTQTLTKTEQRVLRGILVGKTNREIAETINRSRRTVEVHRRNIMGKLHATSLVDLIKRIGLRGIASVQESGL